MNFREYSAFELHIHVLNPEYENMILVSNIVFTKKKKKLVSAGQHFFF